LHCHIGEEDENDIKEDNGGGNEDKENKSKSAKMHPIVSKRMSPPFRVHKEPGNKVSDEETWNT